MEPADKPRDDGFGDDNEVLACTKLLFTTVVVARARNDDCHDRLPFTQPKKQLIIKLFIPEGNNVGDYQLTIFSILLVLLILFSAFFSAAETGLMAINRYRLRHKARLKKR